MRYLFFSMKMYIIITPALTQKKKHQCVYKQ